MLSKGSKKVVRDNKTNFLKLVVENLRKNLVFGKASCVVIIGAKSLLKSMFNFGKSVGIKFLNNALLFKVPAHKMINRDSRKKRFD